MNDDVARYDFIKRIYCSFKDISLGIMIGSAKEPIYGLLGRVCLIELNLIFIHIKLGIVRSGYRKQR